ncbi:hypothetical protein CKM354_001004300 [Cercospora kikuchii]|uniref:F-box domain-containing protein n=1 Tax=Cercospora kikuchii TaxID=84275 RepID=A0A9P3CUK5_9PEZI|nr:uncharacterized protein CKM354_001004300 [Cercospora kikuchii]GIZ46940.1 hypothetical protein CKM354_001004300 [Cercospora kikuchii]
MSTNPNTTTSATSTPSVTILNLPAEVKLMVLSHLPANEVQECRRICRDFKELIDADDNKTALHQPFLDRGATQQESFVDFFLVTDCEESLLSYLFHWIARRGIWRSTERNAHIAHSAAKQWALHVSSTFRNTFAADPMHFGAQMVYNFLGRIAYALSQAYIDTHFPDFFEAEDTDGLETHDMCDVSTLEKFYEVIDGSLYQADLNYLINELKLPLSRAQLGQWCEEIVAKQEPRASSPSSSDNDDTTTPPLIPIPCGPSPLLAIPPYVLTDFEYWYQLNEEDLEFDNSDTYSDCASDVFPRETHRIPGRCTAKRLSKILGGWPCEELYPHWTWCVKSKWADELIGQALEGKGKKLTEMQRAAVIEELYVF